MNIISRRTFVKGTTLASASLMLPAFLKAMSLGNTAGGYTGKVLIVVQLSGGNDGLNTLIPFRNDIYYRSRPSISIAADDVLKITDHAGLHPSLNSLKEIFEAGDMCIFNSVGYPNPDRSHFRAMDIWQSGSGSDQYYSTGWIGRYLDAKCEKCALPHTAIEADDSLSLALKGETVNGIAISNPGKMKKALSGGLIEELSKTQFNEIEHEQASYLYKVLSEASQSVNYLYATSRLYKAKTVFPDTAFGKDLRLISELINAGAETSVYYVSLSGFDTHNNQKNQQDRLLKVYNDGMAALQSELKIGGRWMDTLVMSFSEFGRRVEQNASAGTDHGKANLVFLNGGALKKPGLYNDLPTLSDLDEGDLAYNIDFRSIYASILDKWLQVDSRKVLNSGFRHLDFI